MAEHGTSGGLDPDATAPSFGRRLRGAFSDARAKIVDTVGEDRVAAAAEATRQGLATAGRVYDKAEDTVTQGAAWEEVQATLDDLVDVARTQHAMILDLLDRVAALEGQTRLDPGSVPAGREALGTTRP